jgi:hypothetical protein
MDAELKVDSPPSDTTVTPAKSPETSSSPPKAAAAAAGEELVGTELPPEASASGMQGEGEGDQNQAQPAVILPKDGILPKGMNVPKGIRGVYQMRTAKKNVSRYQVRVWIKRGQITHKGEPHESPLRMSLKLNSKKGKRNAGRRVHLGCFGTLSTSIRAFDIAEIFFQGKYAATNYPMETYDSSPVLHFLMSTIKDRTNLEEFMTVWKHLMQYRWVFDSTEATPTIEKQLNIIKEKVEKFEARADPFAVASLNLSPSPFPHQGLVQQHQQAAAGPSNANVNANTPLQNHLTVNTEPSPAVLQLGGCEQLLLEQNAASLSNFLEVLMKEKEQKALVDTTLALKALSEMEETRRIQLGIQLTSALQQYESLQTFLSQVKTDHSKAED